MIRIARKAKPFRFLELPAELCDRIYELAPTFHMPVDLKESPTRRRNAGYIECLPCAPWNSIRYPIIYASQRIYNESLPILYDANEFTMAHRTDGKGATTVRKFLSVIGPGSQYTKSLSFDNQNLEYHQVKEILWIIAHLPKLASVRLNDHYIWSQHESCEPEEVRIRMAENLKDDSLLVQACLRNRDYTVKAINVLRLRLETSKKRKAYLLHGMEVYQKSTALHLGED